ncbi:carboxypeptidase regulatory-like domain-containing protein [Chloroflexus sp.]|uniref:carboxypeptidase regulatory-like domain-containing protein n=1 Tax=Chloroflexus sp. TaxID=1904827 RepID=UPI00298F3446|nr:carboxypeptidase regulatory-like domain-containing protein [Chloroflexus sp.]MDW8403657.1 carboxypeptidase regulatory-like domain-containing protein [Chloroflexus sp.]
MRTITILLLFVVLTACSTAQPTPTPASPFTVPTPASGQAVVFGRVLSSITGQPIYRVRVAFAEVFRNEESAIYVDDAAFTPSAETDTAGRFVLPNLPPKEYVIVVGDPFGPNDIVRNPDGTPRIWKIEAGQQLDIGDVKVNIGV